MGKTATRRRTRLIRVSYTCAARETTAAIQINFDFSPAFLHQFPSQSVPTELGHAGMSNSYATNLPRHCSSQSSIAQRFSPSYALLKLAAMKKFRVTL